MQLSSKITLLAFGLMVVVVIGLLVFNPSRQMVLDMAGVGQPKTASIDPHEVAQILRESETIDASTLVGHDGLYYLQAGNLIGTIASKQFSAYDDLVAEGKIGEGSTILTDDSSILSNPPAGGQGDIGEIKEDIGVAQDEISEIRENLKKVQEDVARSEGVIVDFKGAIEANTAARHPAASVLDSSTFDFTISGQKISGSVIQSGLKTSLITNDAGFIKNLSGFTTSNLAEGSNLYYTQGRFDAAFGNKSTDNLAQGTNNLYSQWAIATGGITYGDWVSIGSDDAPTATLDVDGSFKVSGSVGLTNYINNGGLLYTDSVGQLTQLAVGTAGQCLKSTGGVPEWGACAAGDSITGSGTAGQLAFFDSGSTLGGVAGLVWDADENTLAVNGDIVMTGSVLPSADIAYDLGSPSFQWRDVYIGPGSLYINGQKVLEEGSDSIIVSADPDQDLVLQTSGSGDLELGAIGTGLIQLKSNVMLTGGKNISTTDNSAVAFADGILGGNLKLSGNVLEATNLNGGISITPAGNGGTYFTNGNVGIGTTDPQAALHVSGEAIIRELLSISSGPTGQSYLSIGSSNGSTQLQLHRGAIAHDQFINFRTGGSTQWQIGRTAADNTESLFIKYTGNNVMSFLPSGRVGIGTADPLSKLSIGSSYVNTTSATDIEVDALTFIPTNAPGHVRGKIALFKESNGVTAFGNTTGLGFFTEAGGPGNNLYERLRISSIGHVGIGTTDPGARLDVQGGNFILGSTTFQSAGNGLLLSGDNDDLRVSGNVYGYGGNYHFDSDGLYKIFLDSDQIRTNNKLYINNGLGVGYNAPNSGLVVNGNVGIGTADPQNMLHVISSDLDKTAFRVDATGIVTQAAFNLYAPLSTNVDNGKAFGITADDDSFSRGMFYTDGSYGIGSGSGNRDVFISRPGVSILRIDSNRAGGAASLEVTGGLLAAGQATLSNYTTNGGLLFTNGSGVVSQAVAGTAGQCLQSAGGGAPTWGACNAANTVTGTGANGQIAFWNGTNTQVGSSNLFWNNSNNTLGINTGGSNSATLDVVSGNVTATAAQIRANSLSSGRGLTVSSTSSAMTTGGLVGLDWSPGSATTMTGDLFSVNVGPNGTVGNLLNLMSDGLSVFSVSQSQIVANVPVSFRAAGNMNIANDLVLSNSTSANIETVASLRIQAGEIFNSSDLTLGTYNDGAIVFDSKYAVTNNDTMVGLGVYIPTARLSFAEGTTAEDGIVFGTDTNLYRSAAGTLKTDGLFTVGSGLGWSGRAEPALSGSGNAKAYFDNISNTLKLSENGGAYADVQTSGRSLTTPVVTLTSTATLTNQHGAVMADASGAPFTLTLPTAVGADGRQYSIVKIDGSANAVTIDTSATQTISGSATHELAAQYNAVTVVSDGANWIIVSER